MTKTYFSPMLAIVSFKNNDIVTSSPGYGNSTDATSGNLAPDRDSWDAGY